MIAVLEQQRVAAVVGLRQSRRRLRVVAAAVGSGPHGGGAKDALDVEAVLRGDSGPATLLSSRDGQETGFLREQTYQKTYLPEMSTWPSLHLTRKEVVRTKRRASVGSC